MTTPRPEPPHPAPAGHRWEVVDANHWRSRTGTGKECRYVSGHPLTKCGAPSVAELNRGRHTHRPPYGRVDSWWAYCADHLYSRWIEDGRVVEWRLAEEVGADA